MVEEITITKQLTLSECGYDEHWLGTQIDKDPTILGIGATQTVTREKLQSSGGRLDLLLKDDEDGMYEVELMLGPTDESHIIRTIEYWDLERKRWPKRSHTAVLVAEEITSRFYNVVRLLSNAVPIIGIAVNIVEVGGQRGLNFTKIIDSYEEPEVDGGDEVHDEKYWASTYPWVLDIAKWYRDLLVKHYGEVPVKYFRDYMVFQVGGYNKVWVARRRGDRALTEVKVSEGGFDAAMELLNSAGIQVRGTSYQHLIFNVSLPELKAKEGLYNDLIERIFPKHLLVHKDGEAHD
jgi:hypothetical protein